MPYVVMIAGAKSISEGGTALVFLANIVPGLLVKLSAPYWFEKVSYRKRMAGGSILMLMSFILVATFGYLRQRTQDEFENEYDSDPTSLDQDEESYYKIDEVYYEDERKKVDFYLVMQLLGVACCSAQSSLGEATLLALSGKADTLVSKSSGRTSDSVGSGTYSMTSDVEEDHIHHGHGHRNNNSLKKESKSFCITAFSSGTGLAGVLGFAYIFLLTHVFKCSLTKALYIAMIFPYCYWSIFNKFLLELAVADLERSVEGAIAGSFDVNEDDERISMTSDWDNNSTTSNDGQKAFDVSRQDYHDKEDDDDGLSFASRGESETSNKNTKVAEGRNDDDDDDDYNHNDIFDNHPTSMTSLEIVNDDVSYSTNTDENYIKNLSTIERLRLTLSLWPYMIPLFIVYAAEYALQSGVWTAIGFPVTSKDARESFYQKSNWLYQVGVFVSRSSGACCIAPMWVLWLMPILQCMNLVFFYFVATYHVWYNNFLLIICFYTGLLGGSVYVNGYMRVNKDLPVSIREFALSTVSIADSLGIVLADFSGLFIQSCLYKANDINGSIVSCPL